MIKLVLSDMDGTLVPNSVITASERTRAAIDRLRASGIGFGCATGRSVMNTIMQFSDMAEYVTDGIYSSGKQVLVRGELVRNAPFPHDLLARLLKEFEKLDDAILVAFVYGKDPAHPTDTVPCSMGDSPEKIDHILEYYMEPGRNGNLWDNWQQLGGIPDDDIFTIGALVAHGQDDVPWMTGYLKEHFPEVTILNSAHGWCDVNQGTMTKATLFPRFLELSGYDVDEILFLADSDNDVELMKLIPNSVCVANAMPSAASLARAMIPADVDDGPAQLMEVLAENGGDLDAALARVRLDLH